jgi:hypothetical protein
MTTSLTTAAGPAQMPDDIRGRPGPATGRRVGRLGGLRQCPGK